MARVTVEDCIDKVDSPYELVLVAKERATQLNSGIEPSVDRDNDKNTVIALREIAVENVKVNELTDSAVYKLRKHIEQVDDLSEDDEDIGDDFESLYKGEISKSGAPILPSKRARKVPEKIQVSKEDLAELQNSDAPGQSENVSSEPQENETGEVSLDEIAENAERLHFEKDDYIIKQNDSGDSLYVINDGVVSVYLDNENKDKVFLAKLGVGDFVGEGSLLTGEPRSANVIAETPCIVIKVSKDIIKDIFSKNPNVYDYVANILAQRKLKLDKKKNESQLTKDENKNLVNDIKNAIINFLK